MKNEETKEKTSKKTTEPKAKKTTNNKKTTTKKSPSSKDSNTKAKTKEANFSKQESITEKPVKTKAKKNVTNSENIKRKTIKSKVENEKDTANKEKNTKKASKTKSEEKKSDKKKISDNNVNSKKVGKRSIKKVTDSKEETSDKEVFSISLSAIIVLFIILVSIIGIITYLYCKPSQTNIKNEIAKKENLNEVQNATAKKDTEIEFNLANQVRLLQDYLKVKAIAKANPQSFLETYDLTTAEKIAGYEKDADGAFIKTDVAYQDIKNVFQTYITSTFFMSEFKNIYKQSNGMTHISTVVQPVEGYNIIKYEKIESAGKPRIKAWYEIVKDGIATEEKTMEAEFSIYNGKWVISNIK